MHEWFMQLPINITIKASFYGSWRHIVRWIQEIIIHLLDYDDPQNVDMCDDSSKCIMLDKLYMQCKNQQNNNNGIVKKSY